jgi:Uma2 family endonuclease
MALISIEEYVALPPSAEGCSDELIQGEIILSPSAKPLHAKIVRRLLKLLEPLEDRGYELATDFGCVLGANSLPGPDLAAILKTRWESLHADEYLNGSPELVVEVFSPGNRKGLMARKAALYLEYGAEAVWVVYPARRTVVMHDSTGEAECRSGEVVEFAGVVVPVDQIFALVLS